MQGDPLEVSRRKSYQSLSHRSALYHLLIVGCHDEVDSRVAFWRTSQIFFSGRIVSPYWQLCNEEGDGAAALVLMDSLNLLEQFDSFNMPLSLSSNATSRRKPSSLTLLLLELCCLSLEKLKTIP
jgi:hypothetical protein